ncbi:hypothetical protein ABK040_004447 [Willaertia magna]
MHVEEDLISPAIFSRPSLIKASEYMKSKQYEVEKQNPPREEEILEDPFGEIEDDPFEDNQDPFDDNCDPFSEEEITEITEDEYNSILNQSSVSSKSTITVFEPYEANRKTDIVFSLVPSLSVALLLVFIVFLILCFSDKFPFIIEPISKLVKKLVAHLRNQDLFDE